MTQNLEILIPLKQRTSINKTILSLLNIPKINLITILSGDSVSIIDPKIFHHPKLRIINLNQYPFSKTFYLNHGIKNSIGDILLISDADIIWNQDTITTMYESINASGDLPLITYIQEVKETDNHTNALQRPRLKPIVTKTDHKIHIDIISELSPSKRSGCGLICATKKNLLSLGGYNQDLQGWGWEDQDLLIRAKILGYEIKSMGSVLHQSHGDDIRNPCQQSPILTRNRNIAISNQMILMGKLYGSLRREVTSVGNNITIRFEEENCIL
ncbi:MAG: galactosyltransferase-related protein [Cyanobacterium sp.]